MFGSYLEGIETRPYQPDETRQLARLDRTLKGLKLVIVAPIDTDHLEFGSYLEGIETQASANVSSRSSDGLDRTLKGLKLLPNS